jgi:hypothetical protein
MRFEFGTVGAMELPGDRSLDDIDRGGEIVFRVKVVDCREETFGRLVAAGDRFPASPTADPGISSKPLLPIKSEALGEQIWDVSVADGDRPYLLVNNRIPGLAKRIQQDALLRGAILVEAFRKILSKMLEPETSGCEWCLDWIVFVKDVLGVACPDDFEFEEDEAKEFIAEAVTAFANKFQFETNTIPPDEPEGAVYE